MGLEGGGRGKGECYGEGRLDLKVFSTVMIAIYSFLCG